MEFVWFGLLLLVFAGLDVVGSGFVAAAKDVDMTSQHDR